MQRDGGAEPHGQVWQAARQGGRESRWRSAHRGQGGGARDDCRRPRRHEQRWVRAATPDDSAKLALLRKFSISGRRQFRLRWGRLNQDLMSFCRLKAMTGAECSDRHNALRFWSDGVSVANEIKAQDVYIAEMRARLARFATTMEEDEAILAASKAGSASPRLVAATRYRHCKKRILKNHIALVEALQPLMGLLKEQRAATWIRRIHEGCRCTTQRPT